MLLWQPDENDVGKQLLNINLNYVSVFYALALTNQLEHNDFEFVQCL